MTWLLVACWSHGLICNVYLQIEFFDMADCAQYLVTLVRENPDVTHANCLPYDVATKMIVAK